MQQHLDLLRLNNQGRLRNSPTEHPAFIDLRPSASLQSGNRHFNFNHQTNSLSGSSMKLLWFLSGETNIQYLHEQGVLPIHRTTTTHRLYVSVACRQTRTGETIDRLNGTS
jgi:hypothetical protein